MSQRFFHRERDSGTDTDTAPAADEERLRWAVEHTISTQQPDGLFRYDFDFISGARTGGDNVVRQAGTLFALGEYLLHIGDPRLEPVLRAGLEGLADLSLPIGRSAAQSALESLGVFRITSWTLGRVLNRLGLLYGTDGDGLVVAGDGSYPSALCGATSLALLAELEYWGATGDDRYRELREAWLRGLLTLHVPGKGIRGSPTTLSQDPYVDGEGWLALAVYHDNFPDDDLAACGLRALEDHILDHYGRRPHRFFYHWGAMASAERYASSGEARLADFAAAQAEWILSDRPAELSRPHPTCSLIEGLASAHAVIQAHGGREALAARIRERVEFELARNRAMQIPPGAERVDFAGGASLATPSLRDNAGAFLEGDLRAYTRTDITQHCISALLKARRYGLCRDVLGDSQ